MSAPVEAQRTKKRKHAAATEDGAGAAAAAATGEPSTKRSKKDTDGKAHHKDKRKDKHIAHTTAPADKKGKGRATHADDAFRVVRASLTVSVAPVFANDLRGGVEEMLDSMLMRYVFPRSSLAGCNGTGR